MAETESQETLSKEDSILLAMVVEELREQDGKRDFNWIAERFGCRMNPPPTKTFFRGFFGVRMARLIGRGIDMLIERELWSEEERLKKVLDLGAELGLVEKSFLPTNTNIELSSDAVFVPTLKGLQWSVEVYSRLGHEVVEGQDYTYLAVSICTVLSNTDRPLSTDKLLPEVLPQLSVRFERTTGEGAMDDVISANAPLVLDRGIEKAKELGWVALSGNKVGLTEKGALEGVRYYDNNR